MPPELVIYRAFMARKKVVRRLAPLPTGPVFTAKDHKIARLLEILRGIAVQGQTEQPQVFYAVRDVAKRFRMPISTVASAYKQLEEEGILSAVRGSKTLLQGLSSGRHFSVLGFIGMPAAVSAFVAVPEYRSFFVRVRRELRSRGFAVAMVFFDGPDLRSGRLVKRLIKYDFDMVLWYRPDASSREAIRGLKDTGVRIIGIGDYGLSPIHCQYEIRRERAITQILQYWRAKARVNSVVVVRGVKASAQEETLERLMEEQHLPFEFKNLELQTAGPFLDSLGNEKAKAIIFPSWAASLFAFRDPEGLMKLLNTAPVAFTGGAPSFPFARVRNVRAELVSVDWQLVAGKIVTDLVSKKAGAQDETTAFWAKACIRADLSQFAQTI